SIESATTEATCEAAGYTTYTAKYESYTATKEADLVEALGHSYGAPEWLWSNDYQSATATFICTVCGDIAVLTATEGNGLTITGTAATCEEPSIIIHTAAVIFNGKPYTDTWADPTAAYGHIWRLDQNGWKYMRDANGVYIATATFYCERDGEHTCVIVAEQVNNPVNIEEGKGYLVIEKTDATCTTEGDTTYSAHVKLNGKNYEYSFTVPHEALGHLWGELVAVSGTANANHMHTRYCVRDNCGVEDESAIENFPVTWTSDVHPETCETDGYTIHTCNCGYTYQESGNEATGHAWVAGEWTWYKDVEGNLHAVLTFTCETCDETLTLAADIFEAVGLAATCEEDGYNAWIAELIINAADKLHENDKFYEPVSMFSANISTADFTSEHTEKLQATGHSWGAWVHDGAVAGRNHTHTRICENDSTHTETNDCIFDEGIITPPTCMESGYTTYTCLDCDFSYKANEVEAINHVWQWKYGKTANGEHEHWLECGVCYEVDAASKKTHALQSHTVPSNCVTAGYTLYTCDVCAFSDMTTLPIADHIWIVNTAIGNEGWTWNAVGENGYTATLHLMCNGGCEGTHEEVATVKSVTTEPTCEADGYITYTAAVKSATYGIYSATMTVEGESALGHVYGEPTWSWSDDYRTVIAIFNCTERGCQHSVTVNATVTSAPSEEVENATVYTATVVFEGHTYTSIRTVDNIAGSFTPIWLVSFFIGLTAVSFILVVIFAKKRPQ
ncbi:MAG: hypothetical protein IKD43_02045, partial [Clostridia bacterium]|nr:hypothetical protein [Clostridia bacterium]